MKLIVFMFMTTICFSESIRIGDRVKVKLPYSVSERKIQDSFKDVDIISINREDNIEVEFRSFNTGVNKFEINNMNLLLDVNSSLIKDKKMLKYLNNNKEISLTYPIFPFIEIAFLLGSLFMVIYLIKYHGKDPEEIILTPKELYIESLGNIQDYDLTKLSYVTRSYLDILIGSNLLSGKYDLDDKSVNEIFAKIDYIKFSKAEINMDDRLKYYEELTGYVEKVEMVMMEETDV